MSPNDAEGMADSIEPDQTAPRSSLIWVFTVCPGLSVWKLRNITGKLVQKSGIHNEHLTENN